MVWAGVWGPHPELAHGRPSGRRLLPRRVSGPRHAGRRPATSSRAHRDRRRHGSDATGAANAAPEVGRTIRSACSRCPGAHFAEIPIAPSPPTRGSREPSSTKRQLDELSRSIREIGVLQPIVVRRERHPRGRLPGLRADHGRAAAACESDRCRPRQHPGDRSGHRRLRSAARRAAGEPAPQPAEPARRGRRLPAAARRLRLHARGARPAHPPIAGRRSPTRCACCVCRRWSSAESPPGCSPRGTRGRCSAWRTPRRWSASRSGSSPRACPCGPPKKSVALGGDSRASRSSAVRARVTATRRWTTSPPGCPIAGRPGSRSPSAGPRAA